MLYLRRELGPGTKYCTVTPCEAVIVRSIVKTAVIWGLFETKLQLYFDDNELQNTISHFVLATGAKSYFSWSDVGSL